MTSVAHICLANARRDEGFPDYRYGTRHESMKKLVAKFRGDYKLSLLSIKELRACRDADGKSIMTAQQIAKDLASAANMEIASILPVSIDPNRVPTYNPFHIGHFYDPKQLQHICTTPVYSYDKIYVPTDKNTHFGGMTLVSFFTRTTGDLKFDDDGFAECPRPASNFICLVTHHMPIASGPRQRAVDFACKELTEKINTLRVELLPAESKITTIHIGDFNMFSDDPAYTTNIGKLDTAWGSDRTFGALDQHGKPMWGTFFPFPHDKPPVQIVEPWKPADSNTSQIHSKIDGAYVIGPTSAQTKTTIWNPGSTTLPDCFYDHMPIIVEF